MANKKDKVKKSYKPKKILSFVLVIVLILGAVFGIREYLYYHHYDTTDDAQVDADISPVVARVGGYVREIRFVDNQFVHKGDTLVILDDKDYLIKLEQAKAGLITANAKVDVSKANVSSMSAGIAPAKANVAALKAKLWKVKQDYHRYENLLVGHAITQSQFDAIKAKKQTTEAKLAAAYKQVSAVKAKVKFTKEQVTASKSGTSARQATIDFAKLQLSYTVITAPVSGIVSKRNIQVGQLIRPGQNLFAIVNTNSVYVTANFKETQLSDMRVGQPVGIEVDAYPEQDFKGKVQSFSGATGAKFSLLQPSNATGNFVKVVQRIPVRIQFDSLSDKWRKKLKPGLSVYVKVRVR